MMMAGLKNRQPLDSAKLLESCDDEESFALKCLQVFVKETQADIDTIAAALDQNELLQVARLAHRIKGASASITAEFLREDAAYLEILGYKQDSTKARVCFAHMKSEFEHFKKFVATLTRFTA
jgi:HPt (histidine-containing phosphotransfer) domain-containing protein